MLPQIRDLQEGAVIHQNTLIDDYLVFPELREGSFSMTSKSGSFQIRQWQFEGIGMKYFDMTASGPVATYPDNNYDVVHLHFNLAGKTSIVNTKEDVTMPFGNMQHNIAYANGFKGKTIYEEGFNRLFFIQFTKDTFLSLTENTSDKLLKFSEEITKNNFSRISRTNGLIDLQMHTLINSIIHCPYTGNIKRIFFLAKCFEMLVLQANYFDEADKRPSYLKTTYDKERILYAREYLFNNIDNLPTIPELARIVGINEYKLKKGFREVFQNSIFGYIMDYKLELARQHLLDSSRTPNEIYLEFGYSSLQHFSSAFKKKFGVSPKALQRKCKTEE